MVFITTEPKRCAMIVEITVTSVEGGLLPSESKSAQSPEVAPMSAAPIVTIGFIV